MKKLIVICMLAAIGAVAMIEKSNAESFSPCGQSMSGSCASTNPAPAVPQFQNNPGNWSGGGQQYRNGYNNWSRPSYGIGVYGGPSYYDSYDNDPGYEYGPDPYAYRARPYYAANRCGTWGDRLRGLGYRNVRASDCVGSSYVYRATRAGRPVRVTVSASSGSVIRVANAY